MHAIFLKHVWLFVVEAANEIVEPATSSRSSLTTEQLALLDRLLKICRGHMFSHGDVDEQHLDTPRYRQVIAAIEAIIRPKSDAKSAFV